MCRSQWIEMSKCQWRQMSFVQILRRREFIIYLLSFDVLQIFASHRSAFPRVFRAHFQCRAFWPNMDLIYFFPADESLYLGVSIFFPKFKDFSVYCGLRRNGKKNAQSKSDSIIIFAVSIRQMRLAHVFRPGCQHECTHVCAVTMNNRLVSIDGRKMWATYVLDVTSHGGSIDKANHVLIVDQI